MVDSSTHGTARLRVIITVYFYLFFWVFCAGNNTTYTGINVTFLYIVLSEILKTRKDNVSRFEEETNAVLAEISNVRESVNKHLHAWNFLQKFLKINQTLYFRSL
jgi:hypothetical protein